MSFDDILLDSVGNLNEKIYLEEKDDAFWLLTVFVFDTPWGPG